MGNIIRYYNKKTNEINLYKITRLNTRKNTQTITAKSLSDGKIVDVYNSREQKTENFRVIKVARNKFIGEKDGNIFNIPMELLLNYQVK